MRTRSLVLWFFGAVWLSLVAILAVAPGVYDEALRLGPGSHRIADLAFLATLSAFLALLSVGVMRSWRWTFWLILVAFLAGIVRVPATVLQLAGVLAPGGPAWYEVFQAVIGLVQFAVGLVMVAGYRKAGVWGDL